MKEIELALQPTNGYINSFTRNTVEGWWELEIGLPKNWVFDGNSKINCEVIVKNDLGKLIKVFPKKRGIIIDNLIEFVEIIIQTNQKIADKEKQFTDEMEEMKGLLEEKAKKFYDELDELKELSFKKVGENYIQTEKSKRGRPIGSKNKFKLDTKTVTEETTTID